MDRYSLWKHMFGLVGFVGENELVQEQLVHDPQTSLRACLRQAGAVGEAKRGISLRFGHVPGMVWVPTTNN